MKTDKYFKMTTRWKIACFFRRNWHRYITKTLIIENGQIIKCGHFVPKNKLN